MIGNQTPDFEEALASARAALRAGDPAAADEIVREILEVAPQCSRAYVVRGIIAAADGDLAPAIGDMREALRHEPRMQPAIEWLAILYMRTQDLANAEKFAVRGLLANPNSIECLTVQGQCCVARGEFATALPSFDRLASLKPADVDTHLARGSILRKLSRHTAALAAFEEAVRLSPSPEVEVELAEFQIQLGRVDESIGLSGRALTTNPESFRANSTMARALTDQERLEEADPFWKRAEEYEPSPGMTRLEKAQALIRIGHFASAQEEAQRAIDLDSNRGKPYYLLVASKHMTLDDKPLINRMERMLGGSNLASEDRAPLHYALGKAYDNLGDYERAIHHFDAANELQRALVFGLQAFDADAFRRIVNRQMEPVSGGSPLWAAEREDDLPLFVTGMMRSGTTLVDQILSCHSQIGSAGEQGFWSEHEEDVVDSRRRRLQLEVATRLRREYVRHLVSVAPGFRYVIDKNPANVLFAGLLHVLFPLSRTICTRRHAVDTALSVWMTRSETGAPFVHDRAAIVFAFKEFLRLMQHWRETIPAARYMEIRYESLIERPEKRTREMVEFCGLEWDDACLHPELNRSSIRTPSFWQVRQPVYGTSVERWKRYQPWLGPFEELIGL